MVPELNPIAWTFHCSTTHVRYGQSPIVVPPELAAPNPEYSQPHQMKEYPAAQKWILPPPEKVPAALGETIAHRGSCRRFADCPLSLAALSTLLHTAYGLGDKYVYGEVAMYDRPVPSGGGCYPLELYVLVRRVESLPRKIYHYSVRHHTLEGLGPLPPPDEILTLFLGQPWLASAPIIVVVTAVTSRLLYRYGDRGYRYLLIEAGHIGQNLALAATATGLSSLSLGGFLDNDLSSRIGLDPVYEVPLYGVALGPPVTTDRVQARGLVI
jgi:SagB-type dehydrogenase family enzyme